MASLGSSRNLTNWQHDVNVKDTFENAPRCRRLESCSKVKSPRASKTSRGGLIMSSCATFLKPLTTARFTLLPWLALITVRLLLASP